MTRRRMFSLLAGALVLLPVGYIAASWLAYPSDRTPEGAYLRIVKAVNNRRPEQFFAYLETSAQHACFTTRNYRREARARVLAAYPEPERTKLAELHADEAAAPDGADLFALLARQHGFMERLRRDMSGVRSVEIAGERATVVTTRGTRYPFRRRENGIWGITLFTATLLAEAEKAARDAAMIERAAADYERVQKAERTAPDGG